MGQKTKKISDSKRTAKSDQFFTETNPLLVLRQAIRRVTPNIGVKQDHPKASELVCRHMDPYISIGKESIEGESDDIFFETNKRKKRENRNHDQPKPWFYFISSTSLSTLNSFCLFVLTATLGECFNVSIELQEIVNGLINTQISILQARYYGRASFFFEIHFEKEWIRMKRMLAYSSIGQIGYVIIGIIELLLALPSSTRSMTVCVIASTIPGISMNPILAIAQDTLF
ncbi:hypothetical protein ACJX0J_004861 [Zea mays]